MMMMADDNNLVCTCSICHNLAPSFRSHYMQYANSKPYMAVNADSAQRTRFFNSSFPPDVWRLIVEAMASTPVRMGELNWRWDFVGFTACCRAAYDMTCLRIRLPLIKHLRVCLLYTIYHKVFGGFMTAHEQAKITHLVKKFRLKDPSLCDWLPMRELGLLLGNVACGYTLPFGSSGVTELKNQVSANSRLVSLVYDQQMVFVRRGISRERLPLLQALATSNENILVPSRDPRYPGETMEIAYQAACWDLSHVPLLRILNPRFSHRAINIHFPTESPPTLAHLASLKMGPATIRDYFPDILLNRPLPNHLVPRSAQLAFIRTHAVEWLHKQPMDAPVPRHVNLNMADGVVDLFSWYRTMASEYFQFKHDNTALRYKRKAPSQVVVIE